MTSSFGPIGAALLALALAACVQNGAFNDPVATSGATGSTSGPGPTTGEPTTGEPTGTAPLTTSSEPGSGSEGATGSTGTSTTGPVSGSSGTSDTGDTTAAVDPSSDSGDTTAASDTDPACEGPAEDLCAVDEAAPGYQICQRSTTWDQAQAACEARCMRLVVLDEGESDALFNVLRADLTPQDMQEDLQGGAQENWERASWWIGGHKIGGVYTWLDGVPMPPTGTGGWSPGNPDVADNTACVVLAVFGKGGANGDWFDRDCNTPTHRFVCEPIP